jgi:hypothetical protein
MAAKRNEERDERVKLPLDPETALRALLAVKPGDEPVEDRPDDDRSSSGDTGHDPSS